MTEYNSVVVDGRQVIGGYKGLTVTDNLVREINSTPNNSVVDLSLRYIPEIGIRSLYGSLFLKNETLVNFSLNKDEVDTFVGGNIEIKHKGDKSYSYVIDFDSAFCRTTYVSGGKTLTFFSDRFFKDDLTYLGFKNKMAKVLEIIIKDAVARKLDFCESINIVDIIFSGEEGILTYLSELSNNVSSDDRQVVKSFLKSYGNVFDKGRILSES